MTTKRDDNYIAQVSTRNRRATVPVITSMIRNNFKKSVSESTVRRRLKDHGLIGRIAVKKPLLRQVNVKKRLKWAKEHRHWTIAQWKNVLWSDESKFEVFGTKRKIYVRRRKNEKFLKDCIAPTVKHGGGSIMVWGCFGNSHVGNLVKIEGILKKEGYHNIIQRHVVPSGTKIIGKNFIFQQDNDPKHTSKFCKNYLANLQKQKKLQVMVWPPQSPDLNPIELLWEELDRAVRKECPTSQTDLWNLLQREWDKISEKTLDKLVARMPRLCEAVIKNKGGHFDEKKV